MVESYTGCDHNIQVSRKDVEQYTRTGVGKPPYYEMTLRADLPDGSTPPDLTLPVTLTGVKQPTTILLEREAKMSYEDIWKDSSISSEHQTGIIYNLCSFRLKAF